MSVGGAIAGEVLTSRLFDQSRGPKGERRGARDAGLAVLAIGAGMGFLGSGIVRELGAAAAGVGAVYWWRSRK